MHSRHRVFERKLDASTEMQDSRLNMTPKDTGRAERFSIHIPVLYREPHGSTWFKGRTENISNSGVLFRAELLLRPETTIEMRIKLPAPIRSEGPAEILCKGAVVRIEPRHGEDLAPALAVAIQRYRLARGQQIH